MTAIELEEIKAAAESFKAVPQNYQSVVQFIQNADIWLLQLLEEVGKLYRENADLKIHLTQLQTDFANVRALRTALEKTK